MLGFQRRGVRRCENDTLLPKPGPLPQTSQTAATGWVQKGDSQIGHRPGCTGTVGEGYPPGGSSREPGSTGAPADSPSAYPAGVVAAEVMDGAVVRRWCRLAAEALAQTRSAIDALNVYPVPDADTGTNLYRTPRSA